MIGLVYKKELKRDFKVMLILTLVMTGFISFTLSIYTSMKESMMAITELYSQMPEAFMKALNWEDGQWEHILGFYATYFVYYVPLFTGAYAIYLGTTVLSREEHQRTAEFLLAKPLSRQEIVTSKLAVLVTYITIPNLVLWVCGISWSGIDTGFNETFTQVSILHLYGWLVCLFFGALGFMATILMKRAKPIVGPAIGIVMGLYFFDMMLRITDKAQFLLWFTPYKYIDLNLLDPEYHLNGWNVLILGGAILVMSGVSYFFYRRKDILL